MENNFFNLNRDVGIRSRKSLGIFEGFVWNGWVEINNIEGNEVVIFVCIYIDIRGCYWFFN